MIARVVTLLVVGNLAEAAIEGVYSEPTGPAAQWVLWLGIAIVLSLRSGQPVR